MAATRSTTFWVAGAVVAVVALFLLRSVLLPFVAGMAVAYFLDPLADRLEKAGCSRTLATVIITGSFVLFALAVMLVVAPLLAEQIGKLAAHLPDVVDALRDRIRPLFLKLTSRLNAEEQKELGQAAASVAGDAARWAMELARGLWSGGMALVWLLSLMFITPVVTFYMLRDWDRMTAKVNAWLPLRHADTIRSLAREIDRTIAGFVRGQASVCLILALYYGIGLTLVGLDVGLIVGLTTGFLSFIPYLGAISGFVAGVGLAVAQFGDWLPVGLTALVFLIGQSLEGNILTPKLVGERIGLHPVWVMFALLAGGALFGFVGVLLAVPVAAVIGVLSRFAMDRYLEGPHYQGGTDGDA
ncbi:MAG: AI-2E family transporter [Alphaproteobacteria bacterium]|nr:AI-2E family transporter [Alphaproteobacteria bacterium]